MNDSLLYMSDTELKEVLNSDNLKEIIDNTVICENDDDFQLLIERIERFDISLAEYLQERRKKINYKSLFEHSRSLFYLLSFIPHSFIYFIFVKQIRLNIY